MLQNPRILRPSPQPFNLPPQTSTPSPSSFQLLGTIQHFPILKQQCRLSRRELAIYSNSCLLLLLADGSRARAEDVTNSEQLGDSLNKEDVTNVEQLGDRLNKEDVTNSEQLGDSLNKDVTSSEQLGDSLNKEDVTNGEQLGDSLNKEAVTNSEQLGDNLNDVTSSEQLGDSLNKDVTSSEQLGDSLNKEDVTNGEQLGDSLNKEAVTNSEQLGDNLNDVTSSEQLGDSLNKDVTNSEQLGDSLNKEDVTNSEQLGDSLTNTPSCTERKPTKQVFFDISVDREPVGRVTIELYGDDVPVGVERFSKIVSGAAGISYRRKEFVKILPNYVQHGGLRSYGVDAELANKTGSNLATEKLVEEWERMYEKCPGTKNVAGSVGIIVRDPSKPPPKFKLVARLGKLEIDQEEVGTDPNGTEFVIATKDSPELDASSLVIGRVVEGMEVVQRISEVKTVQENTSSPYFRVAKLIGDKRAVVAERGFNRPYSKVVVTNCGVIQ